MPTRSLRLHNVLSGLERTNTYKDHKLSVIICRGCDDCGQHDCSIRTIAWDMGLQLDVPHTWHELRNALQCIARYEMAHRTASCIILTLTAVVRNLWQPILALYTMEKLDLGESASSTGYTTESAR